MIIDELTHDDIMQVIEHLHDYCACREYCDNCCYADDYNDCILSSIPEEWLIDAIMRGGDNNE